MGMESCYICRRSLIDAIAIKKRKKLHRCSCKSKMMLNELLFEKYALQIMAFKETNNQGALLCNHCDTQMINLSKYQVKIKEIKEDLHQKFLRAATRLFVLTPLKRQGRHLLIPTV